MAYIVIKKKQINENSPAEDIAKSIPEIGDVVHIIRYERQGCSGCSFCNDGHCKQKVCPPTVAHIETTLIESVPDVAELMSDGTVAMKEGCFLSLKDAEEYCKAKNEKFRKENKKDDWPYVF